MKKHYIMMTSLLFLSACSQGRESFSTEPGRGYGWSDMTQTHQKIHDDRDASKRVSAISADYIETSSPIMLPDEKNVTVISSPFPEGMDPSFDVMRSPDKYMKIWFAPYQDHVGNLHEGCVVHTIVQHGEWVMPKSTLQIN